MIKPGFGAACVGAALLMACDGSDPVGFDEGFQKTVDADYHTLKTEPLQPGEFDLLTLSALPDAVTGGDVLVAVRGLAPDDRLTVSRNSVDVSGAFSLREDGQWVGLVEGLVEGVNQIGAQASGPGGIRSAVLEVRNHPSTGPVISGPHQQPFFCRTEPSGLGEPLDEHCSFEPRYQWFARSLVGFTELEPPFDSYPPDTMGTRTTHGESVPWVVRVETRPINRGIARMAVLDDPLARDAAARFDPDRFEASLWNGNVYYVYGESCGVGFQQGSSTPDFVLGGFPNLAELSDDNILIILMGVSDRLGNGDITVHNTLSAYGNHCNPLLSIESTMMTKEHIIERYGLINRFIGTNGSGAAMQQINAANNAPGLISAGLTIATFADIPSTAMTVADCGLLNAYYERSNLNWLGPKRWAVNGHNVLTGLPLNDICTSWESTFVDRLIPTAGSGCGVPGDIRYDPVERPDGPRCTLQDGLVNIFGIDPDTGFARRPLDNRGVQYGLQAFNRGLISFEEFIDLNRNIGGYDIDGNVVPGVEGRMVMDDDVARRLYRLGAVVGRGALEQTPFIDSAAYLDLIPVLNIHESVRPFNLRARLQTRPGGSDTYSIKRGVVTPPDNFVVMDRWLDNINAAEAVAGFDRNRVQTVLNSKPATAGDACSVGVLGGRLELGALTVILPLGLELPILPTIESVIGLPGVTPTGPGLQLRIDVPGPAGLALCNTLLPVVDTPRIVAGMPMSDDVVKCQLKPVDPRDYSEALSSAQLGELMAVFPDGVCDYSRPSVGDTGSSLLWPSMGGRELLEEPISLKWRVARAAAAN
ncbi:DUF6351 family protein [Sinimarinibacterium flocculans]|uniref:DUF6351 domain-containing protein n=1 Tax=Sinimarinibacterium flocculans TaxID=985250 RepID=A0A318E0U4_9GAMM|nr:DUF6351 family protein [Sinimarinibacterium flocculans]PXV64290.1 hypothetical protein C8D93_11384 [Sinimarinibacterium flocculans]